MVAHQFSRIPENTIPELGADTVGEFRLHNRTLHTGKPFEVQLGNSRGEVRGVAFSRLPVLRRRHTIQAEIEGSDFAHMMLVPVIGGYVGAIQFPDGKRFAVQPRDRVGGVHIARELHSLVSEECSVRESPQLNADLSQREDAKVTWGGIPFRHVVDVLYIYTPETVAASNNTHEGKARLSIDKMNRALRNTPFNAMVNLRGVRVLSGVLTPGMNADEVLNAITRNEQVNRWKEETRADVVQVVSFWNESSRGIADLYPGEYSGVTPAGQDADSDAHEFGHMLFGLLHNRENAGNITPSLSGVYGWRNPGVVRCLMSYVSSQGEPRGLWFANAEAGRGNSDSHSLTAMRERTPIVSGRRVHTNVQAVNLTHLPLIRK